MGSAPNSAISSPTISTKVVNYQQTFLPSVTNSCAQLLSANLSTPLLKTISITSVAPPPHSPSPNLISDSAITSILNNTSNNNTIQENCFNSLKKTKNKLSESTTNFISSLSGSLNQSNLITKETTTTTLLSDSLTTNSLKSDKDTIKHLTTGYIPLSSRTVMENLQLAASVQPFSIIPPKTTTTTTIIATPQLSSTTTTTAVNSFYQNTFSNNLNYSKRCSLTTTTTTSTPITKIKLERQMPDSND